MVGNLNEASVIWKRRTRIIGLYFKNVVLFIEMLRIDRACVVRAGSYQSVAPSICYSQVSETCAIKPIIGTFSGFDSDRFDGASLSKVFCFGKVELVGRNEVK